MRGHYIYKRVWCSAIGEVLQLSQEEDDTHYRFAVMRVEGRAHCRPCPPLAYTHGLALLKAQSEVTCEVIGRRKFGIGLEVPCL